MRQRSPDVSKFGEEGKRENRQRNVYPPPNDGREWMLVDDAAKLYGITTGTLLFHARRLEWQRVTCPGVKSWLLKEDVMHWWDFLQKREKWYKRRRPKNWEPEVGSIATMEPERIKDVFLTSQQAAEYLGISSHRVLELGRCGRLPVYVTNGLGRGRRYWFSQTNLRNLKEDEEYQRWRTVWEKSKATMRQGIVRREAYAAQHRAKVYRNIPSGWITLREMAERLGISPSTAYKLRQRGRILSQQFTGHWDKRRPWFVHEDSVEEYRATEHYQKTQRQGKAAALAVIGKGDYAATGVILTQPLPAELSFGYTKEELRLGYTREELSFGYLRDNMPQSSLTIEW